MITELDYEFSDHFQSCFVTKNNNVTQSNVRVWVFREIMLLRKAGAWTTLCHREWHLSEWQEEEEMPLNTMAIRSQLYCYICHVAFQSVIHHSIMTSYNVDDIGAQSVV